MNLVELKKRGFKIAPNWQECNKKSIFLYDNDNIIKLKNYINLALKKECKFIICNIKFKNKVTQNSIKFFFYKNQKDLLNMVKVFYNLKNIKIIFVTGTNGKTSIAYGANILFNMNGSKSCYIGTLGFYINKKK